MPTPKPARVMMASSVARKPAAFSLGIARKGNNNERVKALEALSRLEQEAEARRLASNAEGDGTDSHAISCICAATHLWFHH